MTTRTTVLTCTYEDNGLMPESSELTDNPTQAVPRIASWLEGLNAGAQVGSLSMLTDDGDAVAAYATITVSGASHGTAATGSYALSGVGGTAASNTVTLGGSAGNVTIVTDGTSVGPVAYNTSDAQTALDAITALNANGTFAAKATASSGGSGVITITWNTKGTVGNSKTLTASRTAGTATVGGNGTTLGGGAQGAVTVTINGTSVGPVDVTNLSDTAAATAVAAAIEANGTLGPLLAAVGSTTNVSLTWSTAGTVGNVTLAAGVSATGTATRSGATMTGGADTSVTVTINGVGVSVDTTTTSTDAQVATAIKTAVNASSNALVMPVTASTPTSTTVKILADTKGKSGNWITLAVSGTGLTADHTRLVNGADATNTATLER